VRVDEERAGQATQRPVETPLVSVEGLEVHFPMPRTRLFGPRPVVRAVDGVSFTIARGEVLGLVGESGSGKSTTGRAILRSYTPTAGRIAFEGRDITHLRGEELRSLRRHMQMVFQDPFASLNPRMRVGAIVAEPLRVHEPDLRGAALQDRVAELLVSVGLGADHAGRYPHALSGGQRQRVGIARALALRPHLIVADEAVSALDVSTQAQIVNLMQDLQAELGLAYLFIAHNLAVVRQLADRVAIMYCGTIVELASRDAVFENPQHPYTQALLSAVPEIDDADEPPRRRIVLTGELPNPADPPPGCRFSTRCPHVMDRCRVEAPVATETEPGHWTSCHLVR
jgi:oligopeptide/dipeptide ABC transporter ATP-binding protein